MFNLHGHGEHGLVTACAGPIDSVSGTGARDVAPGRHLLPIVVTFIASCVGRKARLRQHDRVAHSAHLA